MPENRTISIMENILAKNDSISAQLNAELTARGVFCINVLGAPGVGKTSTILGLIERMRGYIAFVLEADIESDIDTRKLRSLSIESMQLNTHGACHLDAPVVAEALRNWSVRNGILFIENIGNLVCPAEFNIGEHIKMLITTVTDGSDKPYKYPLAFEKADIIIINKADLQPYVDFDLPYFLKGVRALNPNAPVITVSSRDGSGLEEVKQWLCNQIKIQ